MTFSPEERIVAHLYAVAGIVVPDITVPVDAERHERVLAARDTITQRMEIVDALLRALEDV